jgi:chromate reductase, NAD(P)H dehydrogenase (quinone)
VRILGISGSLRRDSYNTALLRAARETAPPGVKLELFDGMRAIPPFDEDVGESVPIAVHRLRQALDSADAILFATPEYNTSIPGQLKNALDWVSRPIGSNVLRGKPVAVIGGSSGRFGAVWAHAELRKVLAAIGARVVRSQLSIPLLHESLDSDRLVRPHEHAAMTEVIAELVREAPGLLCEDAAA